VRHMVSARLKGKAPVTEPAGEQPIKIQEFPAYFSSQGRGCVRGRTFTLKG